MKALIVYYSYSGNTEKVAYILKDCLKEKFQQIDIIKLEAEESDKFLIQVLRALKKTKAKIKPVNFDLSHYDLICFGTPVWAFGPAPAMNTFLNKCFGLENRKVLLFATYGSGLGKERCLDYMQKVLERKGVRDFKRFLIQQFKVNDKEVVNIINDKLKQ